MRAFPQDKVFRQTIMKIPEQFGKAGVALALACLLLAIPKAPPAAAQAENQDAPATPKTAPSPAQILALLARVVENQHRNDRAIGEFERIEHVVKREGRRNSEADSDRINRVLPSGTGVMRLLIKRDGKAISPEYHRRELEGAIKALQLVIHPNARYEHDYKKFEKRSRDRAELVNNVPKAFLVTWEGTETHDGRTFAKLLLEPNPDYQSVSRLTAAFQHVRATMWVDESSAQVARIEAKITSDINFAGGIFGKIDSGGRFELAQTEAAPGIWLPTVYSYDMEGRKFLFPFDSHMRIETSHYRRVWPPSHAIQILRDELHRLVAESSPR